MLDVMKRHNLKEKRRQLSEEEKAEIRRVVNDVKEQVEKFLAKTPAVTRVEGDAPSEENEADAIRARRKRLGLRKHNSH
jgi:hypothetical protein